MRDQIRALRASCIAAILLCAVVGAWAGPPKVGPAREPATSAVAVAETYDDLVAEIGKLQMRADRIMRDGSVVFLECDCYDTNKQLSHAVTVAYVQITPDSQQFTPRLRFECPKSSYGVWGANLCFPKDEFSKRLLAARLHIRKILVPLGFARCIFYAPRALAREEQAVVCEGDTVASRLPPDGRPAGTYVDEMRLPGLAFSAARMDFSDAGRYYMGLYERMRGQWRESVDRPSERPEQEAHRMAYYDAQQRVPFQRVPSSVLDRICRGEIPADSDWAPQADV